MVLEFVAGLVLGSRMEDGGGGGVEPLCQGRLQNLHI